MGKIIIVPDSFKGNMSSTEVCETVRKGLSAAGISDEMRLIPVADGGEGTCDAFLYAVSGEKVFVTVNDPFMRPVKSFYAMLPDGETAVIEMAAASGLPLVKDSPDPVRASSYGTGELIKDAVSRGAKKLIIGLGGSATNDGGIGMAAALGVRIYDENGNELEPCVKGLERVHTVDVSGVMKELSGVGITVACDVTNPLTGENGASAVFGPQKGADPETVRYLDGNLARLAKAAERLTGRDLSGTAGAGAAGGMGFALMSFFSAKLTPGIDVVLDTVGFDDELKGASLVITGEGRIDGQSAGGKVPVGVAARAKKLGVPVIAIVGDIGDGAQKTYDLGITAIFPINRVALDYRELKKRAKSDLEATAQDIGRLLKSAGYLK